MQFLTYFFAALLAIATWTLADPVTIDLRQLAEVARKTGESLQMTPASWEVSNRLESGTTIHVSILRAGEKQRMAMAFERGGTSTPVLRIVSRDGFWYATDRSGSVKYRPYELPTDTPFIYIALARSEPRLADAAGLSVDQVENVKDHVASYRGKLDPVTAKQLRAAVDQFEAAYKESGKPVPAESRAQIDAINDVVAHGVPARLDLATGITLEYGTQKIRTTLSDFHFLPKANDSEFAVDDRQWRDRSDDPTAGDLNDLVMIGHAPTVQLSDKNYDLDGRLMELKTGRFRRIPYPGGVVMGSCFLKGRRSVLVSGSDGETGSLRPYEIDLKTLHCRALGGQLLAAGFTLFGDLSPDGSTLVVSHVDPQDGILKSRICLIELPSGIAKFLGDPMDCAFVNWAVDGRHLILLRREHKDLTSPTTNTIVSMDMEGQMTKVRDGDDPVLLADRRTILYQDNVTERWHTCDLAGKNDKLFGGGLAKYGFPSPAPDGQRILMMHFIPDHLPEPVVIRVGDTQGRAITDVAGLWGQPAWR